MAIELFQGVVDRIHASLEAGIPLSNVLLVDLKPYYRTPDWEVCNIHVCGDIVIDFNTEFILGLLILAAEEELDDYPMEAVSE